MSKKWTIYCHIHVESGRRYVGLTSRTMERRWTDHVSQAMRSKGGRWHFPNAIRKYGKDAFSHEILEIVMLSLEDANAAEERWIEKLQTRDPEKGFNLAKGGHHVPHPIRRNPWSRPEYRKRATEASRKRAQDPGFRAACSEHSKKAWLRPGKREEASARFKGIPLSPEHRAKLAEANRGRPLSPEHCAKMSVAQKGKPRNPSSIAKSAASRKGMKQSPEARANMSAAQKSRPAKTHCKHGHSLADSYVRATGVRTCRTCSLASNAARKAEFHERYMARRDDLSAYYKERYRARKPQKA